MLKRLHAEETDADEGADCTRGLSEAGHHHWVAEAGVLEQLLIYEDQCRSNEQIDQAVNECDHHARESLFLLCFLILFLFFLGAVLDQRLPVILIAGGWGHI